ncbi:MAG: hypothetical protein BroJett029_09700 [Alphaproteobacteria bacterium]|nr:MAG: hypothetical protein BroJett029_09700 [Alphaproteobacteria bacterium]
MEAATAAAARGIDFGDVGLPAFDRRLTDKILAAFNHAYAIGDLEVAHRLHAVLALAEQHERQRIRTEAGRDRRGGGAVDQADLWVAYVEARNSYQAVLAAAGPQGPETEAAFDAMKRAYRRWSRC